MFVKRFIVAASVLLTTSCMSPDIVVRSGSHFTKDSTITLVTAGQDLAIFKPELEKELVRRGFNIISDTVAQVVSQEKKSGDLKAVGVAAADVQAEKAAGESIVNQLTEKQTSTMMKSEFYGRIDYLYKPANYTVARLNFTIIELGTGKVVVSASYERSGTNTEIAREIVSQLETAIGVAK